MSNINQKLSLNCADILIFGKFRINIKKYLSHYLIDKAFIEDGWFVHEFISNVKFRNILLIEQYNAKLVIHRNLFDH